MRIRRIGLLAISLPAICLSLSGCDNSNAPRREHFGGEPWLGVNTDFSLTMKITENASDPDGDLIPLVIADAAYVDGHTGVTYPLTGSGVFDLPENHVTLMLVAEGNRSALFAGTLRDGAVQGTISGVRPAGVTGAPFDFEEMSFTLTRH